MHDGWRVGLRWVLASAGGAAVCAVVLRQVANAVGGAVQGTMGGVAGRALTESATGAVGLGGIMLAMGLAQWLVLRRQVSWASLWLLATAVGGAAGGAAMLGLYGALAALGHDGLGVAAGVIVGLALIGAAPWLVLRRQVSGSGSLALASSVGVAAAMVLGVAVVGELVGAGEVGRGGGFGALYGGVTGPVLVRLLRRRAREPK